MSRGGSRLRAMMGGRKKICPRRRVAQILVVEDGAGARKLRRPKALDSAGCELASSNLRLGSLECVADDKGESHLRLVHAARLVMLLAKLDANDDGHLRRHAGRGTRL